MPEDQKDLNPPNFVPSWKLTSPISETEPSALKVNEPSQPKKKRSFILIFLGLSFLVILGILLYKKVASEINESKNESMVVWSTKGEPDTKYVGFKLSDGELYTTCNESFICILDTKTGTEKGKLSTGKVWDGMYFEVDEKYIYLTSNSSSPTNGKIHVLDKTTGNLVSEIQLPDKWGTLNVLEETVYYVSYEEEKQKLVAFDPLTGRLLWTFGLGARSVSGSFPSGPVIANGVLVVGSQGSPLNREGMLSALKKETGEVLWQIPAYMNREELFISDGSIFFYNRTDDRRYLYSYDLITGKEKWRAFEGEEGNPNSDFASIESKVFHVRTNDYLYAFDKGSGKEIWKLEIPSGQGDSYITATENNILLVVNVDSTGLYNSVHYTKLLSIDADSGKINWEYKKDGINFSKPVYSNGLIIVKGHKWNDNQLYAFKE